MAHVLLHLGTHKTATTTIQDTLAHNATRLAAHGVIYPDLGKSTGHHGLVADWNVHLRKNYAYAGGSRAALQRLVEEYAGGDGVVLLSSEEFSRAQPKLRPDLNEIRDLLSGFDSVRVLCTLREQWQFVQSVYLEVAKRGPVGKRIGGFVRDAIRTHCVEGLWTDYNLLYDHLLNSFAADEIIFLDYDAARGSEGGIVGTLLRAAGAGIGADELETVNEGRSNASPAPIPSWAAARIAAPRPPPPWLYGCTAGAFRMEYGTEARSTLFSMAEYKALVSHFLPLNIRLAERVAPWQPDFSISASPADASDLIFRDSLGASFWLRCNRWMFNHQEPAC